MDTTPLATTQNGQLETTGAYRPALFVDAGEQASYRFVEFFTATIRNPNTRAAYFRAVQRFSLWCQRWGVTLTRVNPVQVALYIEELGQAVRRNSRFSGH